MQGFENYENMFAQSIGVVEPWKIEQTEFDEEKREVHVTVTAADGKTGKHPARNVESCANDMMMRIKNEDGGMGMWCFSHAMCIAAAQE